MMFCFFVACLAKKILLNFVYLFIFGSCEGNWLVSLQSVFAQGKNKHTNMLMTV